MLTSKRQFVAARNVRSQGLGTLAARPRNDGGSNAVVAGRSCVPRTERATRSLEPTFVRIGVGERWFRSVAANPNADIKLLISGLRKALYEVRLA